MKKPETIIKELKKLQPGIEWLSIAEVYENTNNPRFISEEALEELKTSISKFPQMMVLRPGVIDANNVLQGNNQRHKACLELGWKEFPVIRANGLTPDQLKEFMVKDNINSGTWNTDMLFKDWDLNQLEAWNFDTSLLDVRPPEFSQVGTTAATDDTMKHQKSIRLKYAEKDFLIVKEKLAAIADTPEHAIWILLGLEKPARKKK